MSKNIRKTQTVDVGKNLAWEIRYTMHGDTGACLHCNFAEGVGQSLYAFHQWIQHNMGCKPDDYVIISMHRLLRVLQNKEYIVSGKVEMEIFNKDKPNPSVPPAIPKATEDDTTPFDFLAEVPVVSQLRK